MKLIGYVRVSTEKQGQSGLGLEAQLTAIQQYASSTDGDIVHIYREVESGKRDDRPELAKAIAHAKRIRGRLVIAKLDRLARDVHFISGLTKSGADFVACDNPTANKLTVHILAAVAEDEADRISQRTKAALAAAKARGVLLGSARPGHWKGREERRRQGAVKGSEAAKAIRLEKSAATYKEAIRLAKPLSEEGQSLREIAAELNDAGITTPRGSPWQATQVSRLLKTAGVLSVVAAVVA